MLIINMHEAKTNLSKLIDEAVKSGAGFMIAKSGKPIVIVEPIKKEKNPVIYGLMKRKIKIDDEDFDSPSKEINEMFYGKA
ncbi:type II toxin-antitoxin system Phd/YefM family antitoxin [Spirobacillus cienkowskii]|uniref:Antitoxin n=1 Tax=Spirobacillus cienkowskii TaxID=495820 RepID=A0A369KY61_9BACT|nr:MAG: hypothetical protein DCC88_03930 [Spirobacillus cienkowskii]